MFVLYGLGIWCFEFYCFAGNFDLIVLVFSIDYFYFDSLLFSVYYCYFDSLFIFNRISNVSKSENQTFFIIILVI